MSNLDYKFSYLWHAYNSLEKETDAGVPRTQIKVLTQNISTSIGLVGVENAWDNPGTPKYITFEHFITYLKQELVGKLQERKLYEYEEFFNFNRINDVCWMLCCANYPRPASLKSADHFRLWCIFNNLAELEPTSLGYIACRDHYSSTTSTSTSSVTAEGDSRVVQDHTGESSGQDEQADTTTTTTSTSLTSTTTATTATSANTTTTTSQDVNHTTTSNDSEHMNASKEDITATAGDSLLESTTTTTSTTERCDTLPSDKLKRAALSPDADRTTPPVDNTPLFQRPIGTHYALPIRVHADEVLVLVRRLLRLALGNAGVDHDTSTNRGSYTDENDNLLFDFCTFVSTIEKLFISQVSSDLIESAILSMYEEIVLDIIKKGYLQKKGPLGTWKSRWFTVTPHKISWHQGLHNEKGNTKINNVLKIEPTPIDKPNSRQFRFYMVTDQKTYELNTVDPGTRSEWISAIRMCIENKDNHNNPRLQELMTRQRKRRQRDDRDKQKLHRQRCLNEENQQTKLLLLAERKARQDAETKLLNETALLEDERKRLWRLDSMNQELEQLLALERQAKEDEEIVRAIQSRMLNEEFKKSEEMETLKCKMSETLECERQKRQGAEHDHKELQEQLEQERSRLEKMALQRSVVDKQLKKALDKLEMAEKSKDDLKNKMNKQMSR